jgi:hypothetical protein
MASDLLTRGHQLLGLTPVGPRTTRQQLESGDGRAPGRVFDREVCHHAPNQRQRALGFFQSEQLEVRHGSLSMRSGDTDPLFSNSRSIACASASEE